MPIYEILRRQGVFEPAEVAMLDKVFEDVLGTLGLVRRKDPMTDMIAKKLIDLATAGMRDPDRLKALTIQAKSSPTLFEHGASRCPRSV